jgi:hypothetical protein
MLTGMPAPKPPLPRLVVGVRLRASTFSSARATLVDTDSFGGVSVDDHNLRLERRVPGRSEIADWSRDRPARYSLAHQLSRHDDSRGTAVFQVVGVTTIDRRAWVTARRLDGANETVSFFEDETRTTRVRRPHPQIESACAQRGDARTSRLPGLGRQK